MSRAPAVDPRPHLAAVAAVATLPGQPQALFGALDAALGAVLGHRLFTVLRHHAATGESERVYTTHPREYPVGGRKALNPTPWTDRVLRGQQPYVGRTPADIRAVFFDHELIASLGCGSVLNVPVVWDGRTLGTLNLLHEEGWYDAGDTGPGLLFAALAIPGLLATERTP
ncbi:MAG TPA: GAF domain-containing protein [Methylomirabilota bacterium]|nr:GAF domain-containing protein [Methylomirabilota bacterium]